MYKSSKVFSVFGLPVHVMNSYRDWLLECLRECRGTHVVTLNTEMTMQAERNRSLASLIQKAELVIPDGAGIILYSRFVLGEKVKRCPGIELAEELLQGLGEETLNEKRDIRVFFYGGVSGVAATAAEIWQKRVPGLHIVGTQSGYHSCAEEAKLKQTLAELQPQVIFVGLGAPRQEFWIAKNRHLCPNSIWIGVGGSFDIWSGKKNRAPAWLADNNMEWLYRLYQEPYRWQRMLALPEFVIKALIYRLTAKDVHRVEC